jgi:hypothetical protein
MLADEESHEALLHDEKPPVELNSNTSFFFYLPWALNVLFIATTLFFVLRKTSTECPSSFFPTDFGMVLLPIINLSNIFQLPAPPLLTPK